MINTSKAWQALSNHKTAVNSLKLMDLFKTNSRRFAQYSLSHEELLLDYSKNLITDETLELLQNLVIEAKLKEKIDAMFSGERINNTEKRAALHIALRASADQTLEFNGEDIVASVHKTLNQMEAIVEKIHAKKWLGYSGKAITDIVNLGIGGSDLGPRMIVNALKAYDLERVKCHFVSNVDGSDIAEKLKFLNPERTLFIVSSKSFTTIETLSNAFQAKQWLGENDLSNHFIAITSKKQSALDFGIKHVLEMQDWVGGRYSLWSAIGLPIALFVGMKQFKELLAGAHAMDEHFRSADILENMPIMLGLLGVWYTNFFNAQTHAVLPYNQYLDYFVDHLQQIDMESNGKQVTRDGEHVMYSTGPIIWGGVGTNSQHAFHQLLHQGTHFVPVDFIVSAKTLNPLGQQHKLLYANCLSQSAALMQGKSLAAAKEECLEQGLSEADAASLAPHKVMPGNRPSNTIVMNQLTPYTLGSLIALYEHKIFVQGCIWDINSFDQWGVELGKTLAKKLLPVIQKDSSNPELDGSTQGLLDCFFKMS